MKLVKTAKGVADKTVTLFSHEEMVIMVSEGIEGFFCRRNLKTRYVWNIIHRSQHPLTRPIA